MACCRICCGCQTCYQGQQGKCCCGGDAGTCCQPGEYCCSGACQPAPCCECVLVPERPSFPKQSNLYSGQCCKYLIVTLNGTSVPTPIGMTPQPGFGLDAAQWGYGSEPFEQFYVNSYCMPAGYINSLLGTGEPPGGTSSIVMEFNPGLYGSLNPLEANALVEIFRDENCCPVDIQVHYYAEEGAENPISDVTLEDGPAVFEGYFYDGWFSFTGDDYDLYICGDPPRGLCCVDGDYKFGDNMTEYECLVGALISPGSVRTWYADGAYDPESPPCGDNPFP